ncbi:MAG: alpha/beta fold hydrolase [Myxococcales bacterium]|nr:alpha/beta fold hydrolase [Myxococcales bacterium]
MFTEIADKRGRKLRLYYEVRGPSSAPPLLLIRGLARHLLHWGKLTELLESDFRLVLFDNRGMGRSDVPRPPYTTRIMADDAARVLQDAGVERAHVFGMSLGGMIAQEFALRHPARVERLVLGCTRAGPGTGPRIAPRVVLQMLGAGRFSPDEAIKRTAHMALGPAFIQRHPEVIESWQALAREYPPTRAGFLGQLLAGGLHDTRKRLDRIVHPTLVVTGDADDLIHADHSRYLARRIRGAQLEVLPGAAHDFTTERPELAARVLRDFLLAHPTSVATAV